ncbi:MAG: hypothetical protein M1274_02020, partial [Actinobacteria bacterium]|nr:hypothetical protein [Actinomycetota bacterium]
MADQFKYLFTPIKIGPITVRNRIMSTPHGTGYGRKFSATDQTAFYHAERAKGGCGLIGVEGAKAVPETQSLQAESQPPAYSEDCIPGFRKVTDMVHEYGTTIVLQLMNYGVSCGMAPSATPDI